MFITHLELC